MEQLFGPITVSAEQLPTLSTGSVRLWLRFPGDEHWHKVTDVSSEGEGITVHFSDMQLKTFDPDEPVEVLAAKLMGDDLPGVAVANG